ncbi:MAG TPA: circadian clock KaiB family protein [Telluria sp.]
MPTQERAAADPECWILRLYVAGQTPRSLRAVANIHKICADQLGGRYRLEVIDLYQQPQLAQDEQIIALPALIRRLPAPPRMVVGDMSNTDQVLVGLDLQPGEE